MSETSDHSKEWLLVRVKIISRYPGVESDFLFSTHNITHVTYSTFNKSFKRLISNCAQINVSSFNL